MPVANKISVLESTHRPLIKLVRSDGVEDWVGVGEPEIISGEQNACLLFLSAAGGRDDHDLRLPGYPTVPPEPSLSKGRGDWTVHQSSRLDGL